MKILKIILATMFLIVNLISCYGQIAPENGLYIVDGDTVYYLKGTLLNEVDTQFIGKGEPQITVKNGILSTNCWHFLEIGPFMIHPALSDTIKVVEGKEWYFEYQRTTSILVIPYHTELKAIPRPRNQKVLDKWTETLMWKRMHKRP